MPPLDLCLPEKNKKTIKVSSKDILSLAISLIKKAKSELLLTMLIKEELKKPLPAFYIKLLQKKIKQGVKIERLCFGTKKEFKKIIKQAISKNINCYHIKKENLYKRMLMKDREEIIFRIKKKFFYSKNKKIIKKYLDYFKKVKLINLTKSSYSNTL